MRDARRTREQTLEAFAAVLLRRVLLLLFALFAGSASSCARSSSRPVVVDTPPADLRAVAAEHYAAYGAALAAPRRTAIAGFYHYDGALIVFDGVPRRQSHAELRREYEGAWNPPAYFAWENLRYDPISASQVLVTGGFRWQSAGQRDTVRYIYAAMLVAVDSGLGIIFEHETLRPKP